MSADQYSGRGLPHNVDAERALLGAMLIDPVRITEADEVVKAEYFFDSRNALLYQVIADLAERGTPVDPVTVAQVLRVDGKLAAVGGEEYLIELMGGVTSSAHMVHYARIVAENATLRALITEATSIISNAYETRPEGDTVQKLLDESENRIFSITRGRDAQGAVPVSEIITEAFKRIDARGNRVGLTGITSGFFDLDEMTCGWNAGDLVILAARPAMGKTALALNLVEHAAMANPEWMDGSPSVLMFSLEMGRTSLIERMLCSRARVQAYRLRQGRLSAEERQLLTNAADELSRTRIFFDDTPALSIMSVRSRARRVRAQYGLDIIIIDYLQLLTASKSDNRQHEIGIISRGLKALARELEIPIISLAQLSRAVELRDIPRPQLADLRESGSIEQDADVVMMLFRPEYYQKFRDDPEYQGVAEVILAKHRNGPTGTVNLQFFPEIMRFENRTVQEAEPISL
ncbi:MAG: replicative DNA helicase [Planctomycetota bacterium]|jgi:replicative DNA helicase